MIEQHTTGLMRRQDCPARPVIITHVSMNGLHIECCDLITNENYITYPQDFQPTINMTPSRFREHHFQSVAHIIGAALSSYPKAVLIDPKPLACDTMARKLREAMVAKQTYGYKHEAVNEILFSQYIKELQVSFIEHHRTTFIAVGTKLGIENLSRTNESMGIISTGNSTIEYTFTPSNYEDLERLCHLLHYQCFSPRPVFRIGSLKLTLEQIESLESRYNIGIVPIDGQEGSWQVV